MLYEKASTDDKTALILGGLLNVLPAEGQRNLLRDIVGRDNGAFAYRAKDNQCHDSGVHQFSPKSPDNGALPAYRIWRV